MTRDEILQIIKQYKESNRQIQRIGVFGSVAKNRITDESDIDVVVELARPSMFALIGIKQDLEKITRKHVDIVMLRQRMNPFLKEVVQHEAIYV